jgi:hypothetical protein
VSSAAVENVENSLPRRHYASEARLIPAGWSLEGRAIMSAVASGNTNTTMIMIAEKAGDAIIAGV